MANRQQLMLNAYATERGSNIMKVCKVCGQQEGILMIVVAECRHGHMWEVPVPGHRLNTDIRRHCTSLDERGLLHVCVASQFATTQEALCGFTPEHERGWDFPTDLEITKLTTCPDCWNEKGAKKVR